MVMITFRENGITLVGHKVNKALIIEDKLKEFTKKINKENKNIKVGEYKLMKKINKNENSKSKKEELENSIKYYKENLSYYEKRIEAIKKNIKRMEKESESISIPSKNKNIDFPVLPVSKGDSTKYYTINSNLINANQLEVSRWRFENTSQAYNSYIHDNFFKTKEEAKSVINSYRRHLTYEFKKKKVLNAIIRYLNSIEKDEQTPNKYGLPLNFETVVNILNFIEESIYGRFDDKENHQIYMIKNIESDKITIVQNMFPHFYLKANKKEENNDAYLMLHDLIVYALAAGEGSSIFFSKREAMNSYTVRNWKKLFPKCKVVIEKLA